MKPATGAVLAMGVFATAAIVVVAISRRGDGSGSMLYWYGATHRESGLYAWTVWDKGPTTPDAKVLAFGEEATLAGALDDARAHIRNVLHGKAVSI